MPDIPNTEPKLPKVTLSNWISIIGLIFIAGGMYFQINILQKDVDYLKGQWGPDLDNIETTLKLEDEILETRLQKKIKILNDLEDHSHKQNLEMEKMRSTLKIQEKDRDIEILKLQHQIDILEIKYNKE